MTDPTPRAARLFRPLPALTLAGALLAGCNVGEPEVKERIVLTLTLHDSLSRYEKLKIEIRSADARTVLDEFYSGFPPSPLVLRDSFTVPEGTDFIVCVIAYASQLQTAVETWIHYAGGERRVEHKRAGPVIATNRLIRLEPSRGTLSPAFHRDTANYRLILPQGSDSATLSLTPEYNYAVVAVNGDTLKGSGSTRTKAFRGVTSPLTADISVSELGMARNYQVLIEPYRPPKVELTGLQPSSGKLEPDFDPETTYYLVNLGPGVGSYAVTLFADPSLGLTVTGLSATSGVPTASRPISPGTSEAATIVVSRADDRKEYIVEFRRPDPAR